METSELRIGNLVLHDEEIKRINAIDAADTSHGYEFVGFNDDFDHPGDLNDIDDCQPIPLTDEILCDWCGFNKALRVEDGLTKHGIDLVAAGDAYYDNRTGREITTLHQLQNYVYALTGEELEVKLPNRPRQA